MPKLRTTEPIYLKSPKGLQKVGYRVVEILTNKAGDILRSQIVRSKIYK